MPTKNMSGFRSGNRYSASCITPCQRMLLTGGVESFTNEALNHTWMLPKLEVSDAMQMAQVFSGFERM
jgi:hypothetical protein